MRREKSEVGESHERETWGHHLLQKLLSRGPNGVTSVLKTLKRRERPMTFLGFAKENIITLKKNYGK